MPSTRVGRIADLVDPAVLRTLAGPVARVRETPLDAPGFSGSSHVRLTLELEGGAERTLVLKRTPLARDWTVYRTGDGIAREPRLLDSPELSGVWEVFHCPYLAHAEEPGVAAMLMEDLGPYLFPDVREPLPASSEDALLGALAAMHARFWESPALDLPWLTAPQVYGAVLGPGAGAEEARRETPHPMFVRVDSGWRSALARVPAPVARLLSRPGEAYADAIRGLPRTLVHGDAKVANFAILPDGRVSAFDWQLVGVSPPCSDLGWYLAINASRLARPREEVLRRYRSMLEEALGRRLDAPLWARLVRASVLSGALMLLWSKALALESGRERSRAEWDEWMEDLTRLAGERR
jgi:hypothetical protein